MASSTGGGDTGSDGNGRGGKANNEKDYDNPENMCTEEELEEVNMLISEMLFQRSAEEIEEAFINVDVYKVRHAKQMEIFGAHYKWKPISGPSVNQLFNNGAHIVLTPNNSITIKTMAETTTRKVGEGKYLLCRTVTPALKMFAVHVIIEDTNNDGARLVLSRIDSLCPFHPNIIPVGTIFLIKDPKIHYATESEDGYSIVVGDKNSVFILNEVDFSWMESTQQACCACHCPNPAVICSRWDSNNVPKFTKVVTRGCNSIYPFPRHAREWKRIGDKFIADSNDFHSAVDAYTRALAMTPNEVKLLQSRCVAFRGLNSYKMALADAESILSLDPNNMTGVNLKAQCLMSLFSYRQALDCLEGKIKGSKSHLSELIDSKEEVMELIAQEKFGEYNMVKVMSMSRINQQLTMAEYKGPLRYSTGPDGTITGVVTTKGIPRGKLILVKKALVASMGNDSYIWPPLPVLYNVPLSRAILLHNIEYMVTCFPDKAQGFYDLLEESGSPNKGFTHDVSRMCNVMYQKAFIPMNGIHPTGPTQSLGVFLGFPAHIRHQCVDINCNWQIYGEYLMIRASRDIKKGEELFTTLVDPKESFDNRLKMFENCGITCDCRLCKMDAADGSAIREKREALYKAIRGNVRELMKADLRKLDEQLDCFWGMRSGFPELNIRIFAATDVIATAYCVQMEFSKALQFLEKVRPHLLNTGCYTEYVYVVLRICSCLEQLNQGAKAKEWNDKLKKELEVILGGPGDKMLDAVCKNRMLQVIGVGIGLPIQK